MQWANKEESALTIHRATLTVMVFGNRLGKLIASKPSCAFFVTGTNRE